MPSFTVTSEPVEGETYRNEKAKSDLVVWRFELEEQGTVQLHKKPGNNPPGMGTVVNGDLKDAGRGEKRLYLDKPNPNGGGGRGKKQDEDFNRRPDHPLNMARILHTSCLSAAPDYIRQMAEFDLFEYKEIETEDDYWVLVGKVAGRLKVSYPEPIRKWAEGGS